MKVMLQFIFEFHYSNLILLNGLNDSGIKILILYYSLTLVFKQLCNKQDLVYIL